MTEEIRNGSVVWFHHVGLGVRGIVNGDPYELETADGKAVYFPVHQPQTNQNLIVAAENIYRVGERN